MGDINGIARGQNGRNTGIIEASSLCVAIVGLGSQTERVSA